LQIEFNAAQAASDGGKSGTHAECRAHGVFKNVPHLSLGAAAVLRGPQLEGAMRFIGQISNGQGRHRYHSSCLNLMISLYCIDIIAATSQPSPPQAQKKVTASHSPEINAAASSLANPNTLFI
jgi:hypothetical protein